MVERLAGGAAEQPADRGVRDRGSRRADRVAGARMSVRVGVVVFPGSNRDIDTVDAPGPSRAPSR